MLDPDSTRKPPADFSTLSFAYRFRGGEAEALDGGAERGAAGSVERTW